MMMMMMATQIEYIWSPTKQIELVNLASFLAGASILSGEWFWPKEDPTSQDNPADVTTFAST